MPPILKMLFPVLPNLIAIRRKRQQQTGTSTSQPRSSTTDTPGNPSSATSPLSEVTDVIQLVAPMVQAAAEVIPMAGSPLKAAIGGLLQIIQIVNVGRLCDFTSCFLIPSQTKNRNRAALDDLSSRVRQLSDFLSWQPEPQDELEAQRRAELTK
jgi:hypothetical protein